MVVSDMVVSDMVVGRAEQVQFLNEGLNASDTVVLAEGQPWTAYMERIGTGSGCAAARLFVEAERMDTHLGHYEVRLATC